MDFQEVFMSISSNRKAGVYSDIPFVKAVASGNDFVLIDNRDGVIADRAGFTREVCRRHFSIGADGVIFLEKPYRVVSPEGAVLVEPEDVDFGFRIFNPDGSEAEMCGNGSRCFALFLEHLGLVREGKDYYFSSLAGKIAFRVYSEPSAGAGSLDKNLSGADERNSQKKTVKRVNVFLGKVKDVVEQGFIEAGGKRWAYSFANTGVPHVVIFLPQNGEDIESIDVESLGREIRFSRKFQPAGTNVNFAQVLPDGTLRVRTYERGVEKETLSCGTGSSASGYMAYVRGIVREVPARVLTTYGEILKITPAGDGVFLDGEASLVYEGRLL